MNMHAPKDAEALLRDFYAQAYALGKARRAELERRFPPWYACPESAPARLDALLWLIGSIVTVALAGGLFLVGVMGFFVAMTLVIGTVSSVEARTRDLVERRLAWGKANRLHPFRNRANRDHERRRCVDRFVVERAVLAGMSDRFSAAEIAELQSLLPRNEIEYLRDEDAWSGRIRAFSGRYAALCLRPSRPPV